MNNQNWQWWQYFLAIVAHGSLNKAAIELGVSQPTLSRQLRALEQSLGQPLFDRSTQGLALTHFGQQILGASQEMQQSADKLARVAAGQSQALTGRVRLSVNEMLAHYYLPRFLAHFMGQYPQLTVEIEVSNRASNLDRRDADVAIRMFPPTQLDLIARHIGAIPLGFYAHPNYLRQHGVPTDFDSLQQHRVLGYDRDTQFEQGARALGVEVRNTQFRFRTDFMPMHLEVARHGGGIVASHALLCEHAGLVPLDVGVSLPSLPIYLVCHRDVSLNPAMRLLMDELAEQLPSLLLNPPITDRDQGSL